MVEFIVKLVAVVEMVLVESAALIIVGECFDWWNVL